MQLLRRAARGTRRSDTLTLPSTRVCAVNVQAPQRSLRKMQAVPTFRRALANELRLASWTVPSGIRTYSTR